MPNKINSVTVSQDVSMSLTIQEANVNLNYRVNVGQPIQSVNINAHFTAGGASSSLNRNYTPDGKYTPVDEKEIFPFTADFNSDLLEVVEQIYEGTKPDDIIV